MINAASISQVHPIGWALIGLSGIFILGVAGLVIHSALTNRPPNPSNPEEMLRHHTKLLMLYAQGESGFQTRARRFAEIFRDLVPPIGCAPSLQGEIVRSVDRLASEERRNGNLNWDAGYAEFVTVLRESLLDPIVFDEAALKEIKGCIDLVSRHGTEPQDEDGVCHAFAVMIRAAVQYCQFRAELLPYSPSSPRSV